MEMDHIMIYSVTPNPALDLGGIVDQLVTDEKNYVHFETRAPGGNAINAARIMKRLGVSVKATGFLGGGVGREIEELLRAEGLACRFVKIEGDSRVSLTVSSRKNGRQTRLSFPGPKIASAESNRLMKLVTASQHVDLVLIGGSLPPGVKVVYLTKMVSSLRDLGIPCIVDVPGAILKKVISARPLLVKPNLLEFQELVGHKVSSINSVLKAARKLNHLVPLICVSSVEGGSLLVSSEAAWFGRVPKVNVRTTVGAGDSMVGSMASYIFKHKKNFTFSKWNEKVSEKIGSELLRWGLAAAAATLETHGTELGEAAQIQSFYQKVKVSIL
jgi:1-phosphofructokinase family hexose kinase